jgi:phosphonate transport system permease protein
MFTKDMGLHFRRHILDIVIYAYLLSIALVVVFKVDEDGMLLLSRNAAVFALLLVLGLAFNLLIHARGVASLGEKLFPKPRVAVVGELHAIPWYRTFAGWQLTIFLVVTFIVGARVTALSLVEFLDRDGFQGAVRIFDAFTNPEWALLPRAVAKVIETLFMAFMATALAVPLAFVLCFICAKNVMRHPAAFAVYLVLRLFMNITRSVDALIWAIVFSVWVGIGPFAGMLALMVHSVVSLAKQYSEFVEGVGDGPIEGIQSTGAGLLQTIWFGIVPQVILPFISYTIYRWDTNIRMATIVGFVGGGGIGTLLFMYQQQGRWAEVGTIVVVIAFVVWMMDTASAYIREALK